MHHYYTQEEFEFIDDNIEGRSIAELTELFNVHFGLDLTVGQIKGFTARYGLTNGLDCRFQPGLVPANKGKKGISYPGMAPTQFKKGNRSANWVPIGSERLREDRYIYVKVTDGKLNRNWKQKHVLIWEAANGPIPPGYAVIFGDGNNRNFDPGNLILVSRAQLARLNQRGLIQNDVELTRTGVIIADIHNRIGELRRGRRKKQVRARVDERFEVYVPSTRKRREERY